MTDDVLKRFKQKSEDALGALEERDQLFFGSAYEDFKEHMYHSGKKYETTSAIEARIREFFEIAKNYPDMAKAARIEIANAHFEILKEVSSTHISNQIEKIKEAVDLYANTNASNGELKDIKITVSSKLNAMLTMVSKLKQDRLNLPDILTVTFKYKSQENEDRTIRDVFDAIYQIALDKCEFNRDDKTSKRIISAVEAIRNHKYEDLTDEEEKDLQNTIGRIEGFKGANIDLFLTVLSRDSRLGIGQDNARSNKGVMLAIQSFTEELKSGTPDLEIKKNVDLAVVP